SSISIVVSPRNPDSLISLMARWWPSLAAIPFCAAGPVTGLVDTTRTTGGRPSPLSGPAAPPPSPLPHALAASRAPTTATTDTGRHHGSLFAFISPPATLERPQVRCLLAEQSLTYRSNSNQGHIPVQGGRRRSPQIAPPVRLPVGGGEPPLERSATARLPCVPGDGAASSRGGGPAEPRVHRPGEAARPVRSADLVDDDLRRPGHQPLPVVPPQPHVADGDPAPAVVAHLGDLPAGLHPVPGEDVGLEAHAQPAYRRGVAHPLQQHVDDVPEVRRPLVDHPVPQAQRPRGLRVEVDGVGVAHERRHRLHAGRVDPLQPPRGNPEPRRYRAHSRT